MGQEVRQLKIDEPPRVESGAVAFAYNTGYVDWPGLFIRGDQAAYLATCIDHVLPLLKDGDDPQIVFAEAELRGLRDMIRGDVIVAPPNK